MVQITTEHSSAPVTLSKVSKPAIWLKAIRRSEW